MSSPVVRPSSRSVPRRLPAVLALASLTALAAACGDADSAAPITPPASTATAPATRDSTPGVPSAVAGIRIAPRAVDVRVGARVAVQVHPVNADGVPSLALLAGPVRLRAADPRVAAVDDSGRFVVGVAPGTTMLHASVGALRDSVLVRVSEGGTPPGPQGPAVALRLYPRTLTVAVGRTAWISAQLLDAAGRPTPTQGRAASWRIGNAGLARLAFASPASDTAIQATLAGVAPGTTWLHAAVDGWRDSVALTVLPGRDSVPRSDTLPGPVLPARFTLTTVVLAPGTPAGATPRDTAPGVRLAGARVEVYRVVRGASTSPADSLGTPTLVGTATTDAQGQAAFRDLASGFHRVRVVPPAGSGLASALTEFGPPRDAELRIGISLVRAP
jgi:hypothetical protein